MPLTGSGTAPCPGPGLPMSQARPDCPWTLWEHLGTSRLSVDNPLATSSDPGNMVGFTGPLDEYGPLLPWQICQRKTYKADAGVGVGLLLHLALHCLAGKAFQLCLSSGFTSLSPVLGRQPQAGTAAITKVPLRPKLNPSALQGTLSSAFTVRTFQPVSWLQQVIWPTWI